MGTVELQGAASVSDGDGSSNYTTLWSKSGNLGTGWNSAVVDVSSSTGYEWLRFDDGTANLLSGLGQLGSRVARLDNAETRLSDVDLHLQGLISEEEDADITEVILEMTRAEQTLNVAQATGARLIQNTLLNYIR